MFSKRQNRLHPYLGRSWTGYDEYIASLASDSEDEDNPVIKQLQYNAYFDDDTEPGWVIVFPGFKPHGYNIPDAPEAVTRDKWDEIVYDPGLQNHDQVVLGMQAIALSKAGKDYNPAEKKGLKKERRRRSPNRCFYPSKLIAGRSEEGEPKIYDDASQKRDENVEEAYGYSNPSKLLNETSENKEPQIYDAESSDDEQNNIADNKDIPWCGRRYNKKHEKINSKKSNKTGCTMNHRNILRVRPKKRAT